MTRSSEFRSPIIGGVNANIAKWSQLAAKPMALILAIYDYRFITIYHRVTAFPTQLRPSRHTGSGEHLTVLETSHTNDF